MRQFYRAGLNPNITSLRAPLNIEHEATQRAINIAAASGCPLCVVHVSCEEAARAILDARTAGQAVVGGNADKLYATG